MPHLIYIVFLFALGACVGSFLNVVVWRLPRVEAVEGESLLRGFFRALYALSEPPSHCPKCEKRLKWYDNLPIVGWLKLGGKCRFCRAPISVRYPIVEAATALLFVGYYVCFFILQIGPCVAVSNSGEIFRRDLFLTLDGWSYGLDMVLVSGLLAASLIDAELFLIPLEIPWVIFVVALAVHGVFDRPDLPGSVCAEPLPAALALGGAVGTIVSMVLVGVGVFPRSFAGGDPLLEVERAALQRERAAAAEVNAPQPLGKKKSKHDNGPPAPAVFGSPQDDVEREWTPAEIRREMRKEMLFLLPPLLLAMAFAVLFWRVGPINRVWTAWVNVNWVSALSGSVLGALAGAFTVWIVRILGSYGFGRQAMGMGDVDLMLAVGAVLGAGPAVATFFLAPFFGIAVALWMWISRRHRELPYGPYLSLSAGFVMLFYCHIAAYFAPGLTNVVWMIQRFLGNATAGGLL